MHNYTLSVNINKIKTYGCTVLQKLLRAFQCPNLQQGKIKTGKKVVGKAGEKEG